MPRAGRKGTKGQGREQRKTRPVPGFLVFEQENDAADKQQNADQMNICLCRHDGVGASADPETRRNQWQPGEYGQYHVRTQKAERRKCGEPDCAIDQEICREGRPRGVLVHSAQVEVDDVERPARAEEGVS